MNASKRMIVRYIETVLDLISIIVAYLLANRIKFGSFRTEMLHPGEPYMTLLWLLVVSYFIVVILFPTKEYLLQRKVFKEVMEVSRLHLFMMGIVLGYLYFVKAGALFSRVHMALFIIFSWLLMLVLRQCLKRFITKTYHRSGANEKIMLVTTSDFAEEVIAQIKKTRNWYFRISNIAIVDKNIVGEVISGIEVVASKETILQSVETMAIDSVFIHLPNQYEFPKNKLIEELCDMGKSVHVNIAAYNIADELQAIQMLGKYAVVTYRGVYHRLRYRAIKRTFDIVVGLIGALLLIPAYILVVIGQALEGDSGHPMLSLVKVGKGGRRFYMYKFRTMYLDEQRRKRENLYSKTGCIIKALGIENLPVMWNVLWGDMSVVGTKLPSLPEFIEYPRKRRRTLYTKPGLVGLWQVRIDPIPDGIDNDIAELDDFYVENWTLSLDVQILLKSITLLFKKDR